MIRTFAALALLAAAVAGPLAPPALAQIDPADAAWDRGDYDAAESLYARRLAADSTDSRALHRMALIMAWGEHYDRAIDLFDRLIRLEPDNLDARVDRARVTAWRGDHRGAIAAVDAVLDTEPSHLPALQARAQFQGWAGDYGAALDSYERILEISPGDVEARRRRAQVLSWTSRFDDAAAAFEAVLAVDPDDMDARLGLARVLSWANRLDTAAAVYRSVLDREPGHLEALQGLARTATWSGDLRRGEALWRQALDGEPENVASLVGLSQTLRWQGRHAEAVAVAERAVRIDPADGDARTELRWARVGVASRFSPSIAHERDSDGNNITTAALAASVFLTPSLELRGNGYWRELEQTGPGAFQRTTRGGQLGLTVRPGAGWAVAAGAGASASNVAGAPTIVHYHGSVHSPARHPVRVSLGYARRALDVTARLAENGVAVEELALDAAFTLGPVWSADARVAAADFDGETVNRRYFGRGEIGRQLRRSWRIGLGGTAFAFDEETDDGYFSPDFFGLAELHARWTREFRGWFVTAGVAPGAQQVGSGGDIRGVVRTYGRLAYILGPGRDVGISAGYSSHGIESFAARDSEYRYRYLTLSGGWAF